MGSGDVGGGIELLTGVGDLLYFVSSGDLWRSDGTAAGTWRVLEFESVEWLAGFAAAGEILRARLSRRA